MITDDGVVKLATQLARLDKVADRTPEENQTMEDIVQLLHLEGLMNDKGKLIEDNTPIYRKLKTVFVLKR